MNRVLSFLALQTDHYSKKTEEKLLLLLYSNLPRSIIAIIFNATFFIVILWPIADHLLLGLWYVLLVGVTIMRAIDNHDFSRHRKRYDNETWNRNMMLGVSLSALLWGSAALLFFPSDQVAYQMFIVVMLVGMSAGALATLAADLRLSHLYLYTLLIPLAYEIILQDGVVYTSLFLLILLFIGIVSSATRQIHAALIATHETLDLYEQSQDRLIESEDKVRMILDQTPAGIFYYDKALRIIDCNQAFCSILAADKARLIGLDMNALQDKSSLPTIRDALTSGMQTRVGEYHTQISGKKIWSKLQCVPVTDSTGEVIGGVGMVEDKTVEHKAMQQAEFFALHDPLTMLPNRKLLKDRIDQVIREERRVHHCSALLFLDLDHFKQVNDSFGHAIGDKLLMETTKRLTSLLRESDTLSRLGGDEFVILLPFLSETEETTIHYAHQVTEKIHKSLNRPYDIDGHSIFSSSSIGVVILNDQSINTDEVLRRADTAMYQAKEKGRDRTRFYDPVMDETARSYIQMQHDLRHAVTRMELELNFQPIVHIDTNEMVAAEVLLRWHHGKKGYVSPAEFIPVAEDSNLITEVGRWVIDKTCEQLARWDKAGRFTIEYLTINVSSRQLLDSEFAHFVIESIARNDIDPTWIRLEITETALIKDFEKTKQIIELLNTKGIEFVIDDFGTGYSSLSYLKNLPFSTLKIDRAFIHDLLTDTDDEALIKAIIEIAEQFDYRVVAEGVESEAQRRRLAATDNTIYYQGYLYSKPLSTERFEKVLFRES